MSIPLTTGPTPAFAATDQRVGPPTVVRSSTFPGSSQSGDHQAPFPRLNRTVESPGNPFDLVEEPDICVFPATRGDAGLTEQNYRQS